MAALGCQGWQGPQPQAHAGQAGVGSPSLWDKENKVGHKEAPSESAKGQAELPVLHSMW